MTKGEVYKRGGKYWLVTIAPYRSEPKPGHIITGGQSMRISGLEYYWRKLFGRRNES